MATLLYGVKIIIMSYSYQDEERDIIRDFIKIITKTFLFYRKGCKTILTKEE